jgi:predicted membrane protein
MDPMERKEFRYKMRMMHHQHGRNPFKRAIFGLLVIAVGILLIVKNMNMLSPQFESVIFSWPMILVALGFVNLFGRGWFGGVALLITGLFFLPIEPLGISKMYILASGLIIIGGMLLLFRPGMSRYAAHHFTHEGVTPPSEDYFDDIAVFGGSKHVITSNDFKGGRVLAVFGGSEIDLSRSSITPGSYAVIRLFCKFGGVSITVPEDWDVQVRVFSLLGGFGDKRRYQPKENEAKKTLIIRGMAIFGGGEVKTINA